jgi:Phospholipase B
MDGILAGYNSAAPADEVMLPADVLLLNAMGDESVRMKCMPCSVMFVSLNGFIWVAGHCISNAGCWIGCLGASAACGGCPCHVRNVFHYQELTTLRSPASTARYYRDRYERCVRRLVCPAPRIPRRSHCSSLVKLTADLSELYFAHTTWASYCSSACCGAFIPCVFGCACVVWLVLCVANK